MDIYNLYRNFWNFAFENPQKIKPNHCAVFSFSVEHCNRLGWKRNFGLPTSMVMEAVGIKSYSVYKKTFDELIDFGFFEIIELSKNQYSSNIIALKENNKAHDKAHDKALDKAMIKHSIKQSESTVQSIDSIDIQDYNNTNLQSTSKPTSVFTPPVISDVISYFEENGYTKQSAEKAFKYYSVANWKDSKGDQVKNWKQKMQGVWFKDENKEKTDNRSKKMQEIAEKIMNGTL